MTKIVIGRESHGIKARHVSPTYQDGNGDQVIVGTNYPMPIEDHFSADNEATNHLSVATNQCQWYGSCRRNRYNLV